jgi:hypothetical protein
MKANPKWDLDLKLGEAGEALVKEILSGGKRIEVKRDYIAATSGNLAIEFECNRKPSGIAVTQADWWAIIGSGATGDKVVVLVETQRLKELCRHHYQQGRTICGGDHNRSKMVLVPVCEILQTPS